MFPIMLYTIGQIMYVYIRFYDLIFNENVNIWVSTVITYKNEEMNKTELLLVIS